MALLDFLTKKAEPLFVQQGTGSDLLTDYSKQRLQQQNPNAPASEVITPRAPSALAFFPKAYKETWNKISPPMTEPIVPVSSGLSLKSQETILNSLPIAGMKNVSEAAKQIAPSVFTGFQDLSTKLLEKLKGRSTVSKQFISDLTNDSGLKQPERDLIRSTLKDFESDFIHLSLKNNLESIRKQGLKPGRTGYQGPGVYGSPTIQHAENYVGDITNSGEIALRLKPESKTKYGDYTGYFDDERIIEKGVKPNDLDFSLDGKKWFDLKTNKEIPDQISVQDFANRVKSELLPLNPIETIGSPSKITGEYVKNYPGYESTGLSDKLKGQTSRYWETVYESPIKTSAGSVHSGLPKSEGYFMHARSREVIEDGKRILTEDEWQSDLFQKGRLESEMPAYHYADDYLPTTKKNELAKIKTRAGDIRRAANKEQYTDELKQLEKREEQLMSEAETFKGKKILERGSEITKLEPYRNTWHERMARERIKFAAEHGYDKMRVPTGETAMKIEGLGQGAQKWGIIENGINAVPTPMTIQNMKVGQNVTQSDWGGTISYIITDVLGEGKFKAVPKDIWEGYTNANAKNPVNDVAKKMYSPDAVLERQKETFDISGKVDTNNPIYKFYEKEVGKYLKNKYGAELITDPQGVKWWEVNVGKEQKKLPILAFGKSQVGATIGIGAGAVGGAALMSPRTTTVQGNGEPLFTPQDTIEKASPKLIPLPKSTPHNTIAGYNLGGYATSTDALSFIRNTYEVTPDISTPEEAQKEIDRVVQIAGKPTEITGKMIMSSAKRYGIDQKMLLVLIRKETSLGTNLKTKNNPGNILNTDQGGKKEYPTMQEGVNAVARELQRRNPSIK